MSLNIRILSGNRKGEEFKLVSGLIIGRKNSDLTIKDAKVSSRHAEVIEENGRFLIRDLGSRNKIYHEQQLLDQLELTEGTEFLLGDTRFQITKNAEEDSPKHTALNFLKKLDREIQNKPQDAYALPYKIMLHVLQGPEKGQKIAIGYGPRRIGSLAADIEFKECAVNHLDLLLYAKDGLVFIQTKSTNKVYVNGKAAKTDNLIEDKTELRFENTTLLFEIVE